MKRGVIFLLVLLICLGVPAVGAAEERNGHIPDDVLQAADQGLVLYQQYVTDRPKEFGFTSPEEAERLALGEGNQLYVLDLDKLLNNVSADSLLGASDLSDEWEFIITFEGQPRSFLAVGRDEESTEWKATGFGGTSEQFYESFIRFDELTRSERQEERPFVVIDRNKDRTNRFIVGNIDGVEYAMPESPLVSDSDVPANPDSAGDNAAGVPLQPSSDAIAALVQQANNGNGTNLLLIASGLIIVGVILAAVVLRRKRGRA